MNYQEVANAAQSLTYREKLKLAELLIELARIEEEAHGNNSDRQVFTNIGHTPIYSRKPESGSKVIDPNRPWIGRDYPQHRIFVLGESYTGTYEDELEYDDAYISAWLAGQKVEGPELFIKMAEKLQMPIAVLWHQVAFTNMAIGSIGATNSTKAKPAELKAGQPRLEALFHRLEPKGVLILGVKTGDAAVPVCQRLGIPHRTVYHPSGVNNGNPRTACTPKMLQAAWNELTLLQTREA